MTLKTIIKKWSDINKTSKVNLYNLKGELICSGEALPVARAFPRQIVKNFQKVGDEFDIIIYRG